jgi:transposase
MSIEVKMSNQIKHKRPKYSLEFKKDAAKLVIEKGYTHEQAATNLGISTSALGRWVRAEQGTPIKTTVKGARPNLDEHAELLKLRKENEQLRMEREILKKAAVFPSTCSGQALPRKSNKIRVYSRATEDISCNSVMSRYGSEYQCVLFMDQTTRNDRENIRN